jgi:tetratricopeptide (TPR) repeat protein
MGRWDFVSLSVSESSALAAGRRRGGARRDLIPVFASVALAAAIVSLGAPWLSKQRVDAAYTQLGRGNIEAAVGDAERARSLDPLSLDPLFALAGARAVGRDLVGARAALIAAVELQPLDPDAWYELGTLEQRAGRPQAASRYFLQAAQLDPHAPGTGG